MRRDPYPGRAGCQTITLMITSWTEKRANTECGEDIYSDTLPYFRMPGNRGTTEATIHSSQWLRKEATIMPSSVGDHTRVNPTEWIKRNPYLLTHCQAHCPVPPWRVTGHRLRCIPKELSIAEPQRVQSSSSRTQQISQGPPQQPWRQQT